MAEGLLLLVAQAESTPSEFAGSSLLVASSSPYLYARIEKHATTREKALWVSACDAARVPTAVDEAVLGGYEKGLDRFVAYKSFLL